MWPIYANHHCGWMQIWFVRNLSFHHATLQPATKTGEKEGEIWGRCNDTSPTDVFLSADKFPCSSTKTNRNLSVAAFLKTNPGSLGQPAVGEVRRCLCHLRLASSSHHWGKAWSSPWGWGLWRCGGKERAGAVLQPALDRALGITTSRCPSPAKGGLRATSQRDIQVIRLLLSSSLQAHNGLLLCPCIWMVKSLDCSVLELNLSFVVYSKRDNRYS